MVATLQASSGLRDVIANKEKYEDGGHVQVCMSHVHQLHLIPVCSTHSTQLYLAGRSSSSPQNGVSATFYKCDISSRERDTLIVFNSLTELGLQVTETQNFII